MVVRAVAAALGASCEPLLWDPEPVLLETANVWHLATRFVGRVRDPSVSVLDLVDALHPTPAVCGTPTEAALDAIANWSRSTEDATPAPWDGSTLGATGSGRSRCGAPSSAASGRRSIAGAGIVAGSEPARKLDETGRKFRAFLDSLRWG